MLRSWSVRPPTDAKERRCPCLISCHARGPRGGADSDELTAIPWFNPNRRPLGRRCFAVTVGRTRSDCAGGYDQWYLGTGLFAGRDRPGWHDAVEELVAVVGGLAPARTLDLACGTGFLTRHLRGFVVGVDQSRAMVAVAQSRLPDGLAIAGDALDLVVADGSFERVFTAHFYGHLPPGERGAFLAEARRVGAELVVVDSALRPGVEAEQVQKRVLMTGPVTGCSSGT